MAGIKDNDILLAIQGLSNKIDTIQSDVNDMKSDVNSMKSDVNSVKLDVNSVKSDVNSVKSDVNSMKSDMNERFNKVSDNFEDLDARFDVMDSNMMEIQDKANEIDLSLKDTKLVIENGIKPSINVIAEQHLSMNEKIDDLIAKKEKLEYKVGMHDLQLLVQKEDIEKIKKQLATIA